MKYYRLVIRSARESGETLTVDGEVMEDEEVAEGDVSRLTDKPNDGLLWDRVYASEGAARLALLRWIAKNYGVRHMDASIRREYLDLCKREKNGLL